LKKLLLIILILSVLYSNLFAGDKKVLDISGQESCLTPSCHTDIPEKEFVHVPASDGEMCVECHEMPTKGRHTFQLKAEGADLCYECHESKSDAEYVHVPVEAGECVECHDPHSSDNSFQLKAEGADLCYECHESKVEAEYVHVPVEAGECVECHSPHQSKNPFQLLYPPTSELCFQCHDEDEFNASGSIHGPVSEGLCLKCHNPHSSDYPSQTKDSLPQLCFRCHNKTQKDPEGRRLPSIKAIYEDKEMLLHKPFGKGECTLCHYPHVSEETRLLKRKYPALFYAKFSLDEYALCLGCHKTFTKALTEPRTLTETNFRNGNLNLHYRHVNKKKGRTCRACHHHHGSKNPKLIRSHVPFGQREISLTYKKTETGGECTPTCHMLVGYDRYEPVFNALKTTPREGVDATEEELKKSRERDQKKASAQP
jgi:predicted CXXCH cytochrome family protein